MDEGRLQIEQAERQVDLQWAAELCYSRLRADRFGPTQDELREAGTRLGDLQEDGAVLREEVDEEDSAYVVSRWTGVPTTRLLESEMEKRAYRSSARSGGGSSIPWL